jgi:DNA (cytosine-5)-methyltransferase 1
VLLALYCCREEAQYTREPASAYQRFIRGKNTVLLDHVCKEMNELNLERCRYVHVPGSDVDVSNDS